MGIRPEYVVDTPDRARRGAAGLVERVGDGSTALAETRRVLQRACDSAHQPICASDHVGRASQEAHLIRANTGLLDRPGQSMTTTGRSSSMNSNPIELWSVISASATKRYGDAFESRATWTRDSELSCCRRARQSAPPDPRSVGSYDRSCSFTMRLRPRRGSVSMTALPKAFSDEWGDHVGA